MLQIKVVIFWKLYFNIKHFLIGIIDFLINIENAFKHQSEIKIFKEL